MQLLLVQLEATEVAAPGRMRDTSRAGEKPARLLLHAHPRRIARTICPMLRPDASHVPASQLRVPAMFLDASHVPASQLLACSVLSPVLHRLATHIISSARLASYTVARLHAHAHAAVVLCSSCAHMPVQSASITDFSVNH